MRLRQAGASRPETEEVLQETFLTVWRSAESYRGEGATAAWMWGIAKRKYASAVRSNVRRRIREATTALPESSEPSADEGGWVMSVDAARAVFQDDGDPAPQKKKTGKRP